MNNTETKPTDSKNFWKEFAERKERLLQIEIALSKKKVELNDLLMKELTDSNKTK